jgi:hypothetical protein
MILLFLIWLLLIYWLGRRRSRCGLLLAFVALFPVLGMLVYGMDFILDGGGEGMRTNRMK